METFFEHCRDFILEQLPEFEGNDVYACDLPMELTQGMNCDGTFTYSTKKAIELIHEWWDDCSDFSDYEKFEFGERSNPFDNPEAFLVRMVTEGVNIIMQKSNFIQKKWNAEKIELTPAVLRLLRRQIGSLVEDCDFRYGVFDGYGD